MTLQSMGRELGSLRLDWSGRDAAGKGESPSSLGPPAPPCCSRRGKHLELSHPWSLGSPAATSLSLGPQAGEAGSWVLEATATVSQCKDLGGETAMLRLPPRQVLTGASSKLTPPPKTVTGHTLPVLSEQKPCSRMSYSQDHTLTPSLLKAGRNRPFSGSPRADGMGPISPPLPLPHTRILKRSCACPENAFRVGGGGRRASGPSSVQTDCRGGTDPGIRAGNRKGRGKNADPGMGFLSRQSGLGNRARGF